jgi:hypothetical protein
MAGRGRSGFPPDARLPLLDVYFVANASASPVSLMCSFTALTM